MMRLIIYRRRNPSGQDVVVASAIVADSGSAVGPLVLGLEGAARSSLKIGVGDGEVELASGFGVNEAEARKNLVAAIKLRVVDAVMLATPTTEGS